MYLRFGNIFENQNFVNIFQSIKNIKYNIYLKFKNIF